MQPKDKKTTSSQNGMRMTFEEVTPEIALEWIAAVPDYQRRRTPRRVAAIQWDIEHDLWRPTHQAFAFTSDGELVDGQHRAEAIVNAQATVGSWVCRGVPRESYVAIDAGKPRTIEQVADITKEQAALVRQLLRVEFKGAIVPSNQEILAWYDAYAHSIDKVIADTTGQISGSSRVPNAVVRGAIVRATYHMTTDAYARMIHLLYEGSVPVLEPGDKAILRLREYVLNGFKVRSLSTAESRDTIHSKAQTAIRAYIRGIDLQYLRASDTEFFPLPGAEGLDNA